MKKSVVVVSSGQLSANPRAVKEAIALFEHGYKVTVIYVPISEWADDFDQGLIDRFDQISWIKCGYHRDTELWRYAWSRMRRRIWDFIFKVVGDWNDASIKSMVLFSQELRAKASNIEADLYIGHNLGALPAIVTAANKFNSKSIFDFEDYHRGENAPTSVSIRKTIALEQKYVTRLSGVTFSSNCIAQKYRTHFPHLEGMTIRNVFFKDYLVKNDFQTFRLPLQLFWFSQKIGKGRGLENVFRSLAQFKENEVQLNLLGSITSADKSYFESLRNELGLAEHRVIYLAPVAESQLTAIAGKFHIGLACEPGRDMNNELALSNKIFIYMLGGLAVLASNTQSQTEFLNRYVGVGKPFVKESPESLSGQIQFFLENPDELMRARINARNLALSELNWEEEQKLFLNNVLSVLESA